WFDRAMGVTLFAVVIIVVFAGLLWWWARAVAQHESALQESRTAEQSRRRELEGLLEAAPSIVWIAHDRDCKVIAGNRAASDFLGLREEKNMSLTAPSGAPQHFQVFRDGKRLTADELPMQHAARTGQPVLGVEVEHR